MSDTHCTLCGQVFYSDGCGTGYGTNLAGERICYACCGKLDEAELLSKGELIGYLSYTRLLRPWNGCGLKPDPNLPPINYHDMGAFMLESGAFSNWPGSFKIPISQAVKRSFNNFGAPRIDFWFTFHGQRFHGVNVGDNSQIARVKRVKGKA